jgi:hypothetical protein
MHSNQLSGCFYRLHYCQYQLSEHATGSIESNDSGHQTNSTYTVVIGGKSNALERAPTLARTAYQQA